MGRSRLPQSVTMFRRVAAAACLLGLVAVAPVSAGAPQQSSDPPLFSWRLLDSGTRDHLVSLDAVNDDVVWAGSDDWRRERGSEVLLTVDGGATFSNVAPQAAVDDGLDFIHIEAWSAEDALVLAYRFGDAAHIYRTTDGGRSWTEAFRAEDPTTEFFCMAMLDRRHGFVVGSPSTGNGFEVILTSDAGRSWIPISQAGMPPADPGEGLIHGNCATATGRKAFFGTRATDMIGVDHVYRSADHGLTWEVSPTPSGAAIYSLDFRTNHLGVTTTGVRTTDGGVTWSFVEGFGGGDDVAWWSDARDERTLVPDSKKIVFAVGRASLVSLDRGKTWDQFDDREFSNVDCAQATAPAGPRAARDESHDSWSASSRHRAGRARARSSSVELEPISKGKGMAGRYLDLNLDVLGWPSAVETCVIDRSAAGPAGGR